MQCNGAVGKITTFDNSQYCIPRSMQEFHGAVGKTGTLEDSSFDVQRPVQGSSELGTHLEEEYKAKVKEFIIFTIGYFCCHTSYHY